jgi:hypothetical protein
MTAPLRRAHLRIWLVLAIASYAVFAAVFVAFGIGRVDPIARQAPLGFRLVVLPGCAALWPLLLRRWVTAS